MYRKYSRISRIRSKMFYSILGVRVKVFYQVLQGGLSEVRVFCQVE